MKKTFIIEHLEPEIGKWCLIEYEHMSQEVGKDNIIFSNIKKGEKNASKLAKFGKITSQRVWEMGLDKNRVCVLDPDVDVCLTPEDADKFDYFIFGGILGDNPPRKRTGPELTQFMKGCVARNIGKEQMSTDNAVYTVNKIISGTKFEELKFQDEAVIQLNKVESFILPYRYNIVGKKPYMSKKLIEYLKKKKDF